MKRISFFLLVLLTAGAALGDAVYKWVDSQGVVHYSDQPVPGAVKVKAPRAQTFTAPAAGNLPTPNLSNNSGGPAPSYTRLVITAPTDQQTFWNQHSVTVSVDLQPGLQGGDTLTISVDGQSKTGTGMSATFDDLYRGEHSAAASVTSNGTKVIVATPVTFYIQQPAKGH
ncbi:MAG: DUF4124 domain-containing protein [Bacillota bacterium]